MKSVVSAFWSRSGSLSSAKGLEPLESLLRKEMWQKGIGKKKGISLLLRKILENAVARAKNKTSGRDGFREMSSASVSLFLFTTSLDLFNVY